MKTIPRFLVTLACVAAAASATFAAEGAIPIFQPTVITAPGDYILTRSIDMTGVAGTIIEIQSTGVNLDLNQHRLACTYGDASCRPIVLQPPYLGIEIRNGALLGGEYGIYATPSGSILRVMIEEVSIVNPVLDGIALPNNNLSTITIRGCRIANAYGRAIRIDGTLGSFTAQISDNIIHYPGQEGMVLVGLRSGEVRNNHILDAGGSEACGIRLGASENYPEGGNLVIDNTVDNAGTGICIDPTSHNNRLVGNNITNNVEAGIRIRSNHNHLEGNLVSGTLHDGILIDDPGSGNLLSGNQIAANGDCGVSFVNTNDHAYRDNMLRGNGTAVCGPPNTDAGGNIY